MRAWQIESQMSRFGGTRFWLQLDDGTWAWKNLIQVGDTGKFVEQWCHSIRKDYMNAEMLTDSKRPELPSHLVKQLFEEFEMALSAGNVTTRS